VPADQPPAEPTRAAPAITPTDFSEEMPGDEPTWGQGAAASGRAVQAHDELGDAFHRSLIYSGGLGLALAIIGFAMVARRRRSW
jgi:hypothetical protein